MFEVMRFHDKSNDYQPIKYKWLYLAYWFLMLGALGFMTLFYRNFIPRFLFITFCPRIIYMFTYTLRPLNTALVKIYC